MSCSSFADNSPVDIEKSYVNRQILLRAPDLSNTFGTKDPIYLELESNSNNEIVFPNNYNLRIFERSDGDWIPISEIPTRRLPEGDMVFSPMKKGRETTYVDPDLKDFARKYQLRIYVIGDMKTDEGIKQVAAYVDVELHP
jgi:hypothetical protein